MSWALQNKGILRQERKYPLQPLSNYLMPLLLGSTKKKGLKPLTGINFAPWMLLSWNLTIPKDYETSLVLLKEAKNVRLARAMASGIYDLENDMMIVSTIAHFHSSERDLAIEMMEKLKVMGLKNDLLLFDRGYPSRDFLAYLDNSSLKYVIRVGKKTMKEVMHAHNPDQVVEIKVNGKVLKVRVLRFLLDSGNEEVLVTNLLDESMGIQDFKELYFRRWGIGVSS